jgi:hypothetical protein
LLLELTPEAHPDAHPYPGVPGIQDVRQG